MKFIDVHTVSDDDRYVSLAIDKNNHVTLLGNLPHNTEIIITQELVNQLQEYLNQKEVAK